MQIIYQKYVKNVINAQSLEAHNLVIKWIKNKITNFQCFAGLRESCNKSIHAPPPD